MMLSPADRELTVVNFFAGATFLRGPDVWVERAEAGMEASAA